MNGEVGEVEIEEIVIPPGRRRRPFHSTKRGTTVVATANQTYQVMPPLTPEDRQRLKEEIKEAGKVLIPIVRDEKGDVLDGHTRLELVEELRAEGVKIPDLVSIIGAGLSEVEKRSLARSLNLARRHLTKEQRQQIVDDQLRETLGRSDRRIAESLGVNRRRVSNRRRHLESTGAIAPVEKTEGKDGKKRPARRPSIFVKNAAEARKVCEVLSAVPAEELSPRVMDARQATKMHRQ
jgi:hypothetical protein